MRINFFLLTIVLLLNFASAFTSEHAGAKRAFCVDVGDLPNKMTRFVGPQETDDMDVEEGRTPAAVGSFPSMTPGQATKVLESKINPHTGCLEGLELAELKNLLFVGANPSTGVLIQAGEVKAVSVLRAALKTVSLNPGCGDARCLALTLLKAGSDVGKTPWDGLGGLSYICEAGEYELAKEVVKAFGVQNPKHPKRPFPSTSMTFFEDIMPAVETGYSDVFKSVIDNIGDSAVSAIFQKQGVLRPGVFDVVIENWVKKLGVCCSRGDAGYAHFIRSDAVKYVEEAARFKKIDDPYFGIAQFSTVDYEYRPVPLCSVREALAHKVGIRAETLGNPHWGRCFDPGTIGVVHSQTRVELLPIAEGGTCAGPFVQKNM